MGGVSAPATLYYPSKLNAPSISQASFSLCCFWQKVGVDTVALTISYKLIQPAAATIIHFPIPARILGFKGLVHKNTSLVILRFCIVFQAHTFRLRGAFVNKDAHTQIVNANLF